MRTRRSYQFAETYILIKFYPPLNTYIQCSKFKLKPAVEWMQSKRWIRKFLQNHLIFFSAMSCGKLQVERSKILIEIASTYSVEISYHV